jgi:hypothetical protein
MRCPGTRKNKGDCIPKPVKTVPEPAPKRCPNGTRKNKGVCIPKPVKTVPEPVKPVQSNPAPKRCPNGTRKNKGVCIPKPVKPKRCPNGTRKNKGVCEPKTKPAATPRTQYACRFNKPIYLSERELFQIHVDADQFKDYTNLSKAPKLDCGYQSLFALGLIEVEHAKKSAEEVNTKGKVGIFTNELKTFFRINFGFTPEETIHTYERRFIKLFLENNLANNHATILLLHLEKNGHYIVAYKYKDMVHFYDPQATKHRTVDETMTFDYFKVKVDGPKLFNPIQKSLPYIG